MYHALVDMVKITLAKHICTIKVVIVAVLLVCIRR